MTDVFVRKSKDIKINLEAGRIHLIVDGQLILDMTHQQCLMLGRAFIMQARKTEEMSKGVVDQVVLDAAILMRAGIPLRLATNDHIHKEAMKEAAWNSDLRRYMPNNLEKVEQHGTLYPPVVTKEKP